MNKISLVFLICLTISFLSCQDDEMAGGELIGTWVVDENTSEGIVYKKSRSFNDNFGFQFMSNGELIQNTYSGWCGTPPVTLAEVDGTWTRDGDLLITTVEFFWTTAESRYFIEKLTNRQLILVRE